MRYLTLFVLLSISAQLFLSSVAQPTSAPEPPKNATLTCPSGCSGKGQCHPGPRCQCINGFSGDACEFSVAKAIPVEFGLTRAFCSIGFFIIFALASLTLYSRWNRHQTAGLLNASKIIMIEIVILSLANILMWSIDPFGFNGTVPFWLTRIFFIITFPLLSTVYCTVLFHWAEVYFSIAERMKKETALSKINKNYNPNVTLEGVLSSMSFINRIKIPFIVLIVFEWLLMIIRECLIQTKTIGTGEGSRGAWVQYFWIWYFTLVYGIECAGFFFWGPRLVKSMPEALQAKMRRVTRLVQIASLCFFFLWLPVAIVNTIPQGRSPYAFLGGDWCLRVAAMIVCSIVLSIFIQVRKEWPFFFFGGITSKTSGTDRSGEGSNNKGSHSGGESDIALDSIPTELEDSNLNSQV
eukprot:TRINITY_DN1222_c0_g1_i1.p1 TRINITY_DN1222_c0_g1~~TRINITY_DN1222_c0_g1_i1.p1  ORF type:complete len:409 (-),score=84.55 TRINITY_DN1222_c0_g1_i1:56-1282(-)